MSCNNKIDLSPVKQDVDIWKDDTWAMVLKVTTNTVPVSFLGATIVIQIRKTIESAAIEMTLTTAENTITISGAGNNIITLNKKITLDAGSYVYDMNVTFPNTQSKTYIYGKLNVEQNITRL